MPRPRGDHAQRRRLVVQAACRLIARHGVQGATIRAIARDLGIATKAITRYFRSKDEMLVVALDYVIAEQMKASASTRTRMPSRRYRIWCSYSSTSAHSRE